MKYYRIIITQNFMGETLQDSYKKHCTFDELQYEIDAIYSDPHVTNVRYEVIN